MEKMGQRARFDVLIIGGGPAGLNCGIHLARKNLSVGIFERREIPYRKVCGEILSPRAVEELSLSGIDLSGFHAVGRIHAFAMPFHVDLSFEELRCRMVPRDRLQEVMVERVWKEGGKVFSATEVKGMERSGGKWRVEASGFTYESPVLIGADGFGSTTRRFLSEVSPRKKDIAIGVRAVLEMETDDSLRFYIVDAAMPGYAWIFSLGGGLVNAGFGIRADHYKERGIHPVRDFFRFFSSVEPDGFRGGNYRIVIPPETHPIYLGSHIGETVFPGALLIGEAAGFVNPFTGEGISYALISGRLAAEAVWGFLSEGRSLFEFDRMWRKEFGFSFVMSKVYQRLSSKKLIEKVMEYSSRYEDVRRTITETLLGYARFRMGVYLKILGGMWKKKQEVKDGKT